MDGFRNSRWLALTTALILALSGTAFAQTETGNIYGTVTDNTGAALPGSTATLTGPVGSRTAVADAGGQFRFLGLDPGNYQLETALDGFGTVIYEEINIRVGRNTTLEIELSPAIEETITVTTESPLLDQRKIKTGIEVTSLELQKIPTARDPWAIAGQTPGVLMDRINVGGNESGQQPTFVGTGAGAGSNVFMIDGVDITDQAALGASSTYFGFEQFDEMAFSTGGTDIEVQTPGVQVSMVTKRGTNEWRGSGSYNRTDGDWQASDNLDKGDLAPGQADAGESLTGNQIDLIEQFGAEVGGFLWKDRIWIWGAYDENDIAQSVFGGGVDNTLLENTAVKLNAQITGANSFVYTWNEGEKIKNGRGAGPDRPPETTWDQGGPSPLQKLEDTHVFGSSFFVTGSWSEMKGGFFLEPQGGRTPQMWQDASGTYHGSYQYLDSSRPTERWKADGSTFFTTGGLSHELKFGASFRDTVSESSFGQVGNGVVTYACEVWGCGEPYDSSGNGVSGVAWRDKIAASEINQQAIWLQDTFTTDRLTVNVGLRYDKQDGKNRASTVPQHGFAPELLPEVAFQGDSEAFEWTDISPRIGATYALGENRETLVRASYSRFVDGLGHALIEEVNPAAYSFAAYYGTDTNGNGILDTDEPREFSFPFGFTPGGDATINPSRFDPDLEALVTDEVTVGVEHALMPEFVLGATFTWRKSGDYYHEQPIFTDPNGVDRVLTRDDYVLDHFATGTLPFGGTYSEPVFTVRDGFTDTGGVFITNSDRETEYQGITLSATKRLSNKWMMRAHVTYYDWDWKIGEGFERFDDPTDVVNANSDPHEWDADDNGAIYAEQSGGSGNVDLYLNSRWSFNISGMYQLPWGINVAGNINGREGYPVPFFDAEGRNIGGTVDVQVGESDDFRVDDIITTDVRVDKEFQISDFGITVGLDIFNLFNDGYVVQRENDLGTSRAGFVDQIIGPRIARLSVRLAFK